MDVTSYSPSSVRPEVMTTLSDLTKELRSATQSLRAAEGRVKELQRDVAKEFKAIMAKLEKDPAVKMALEAYLAQDGDHNRELWSKAFVRVLAYATVYGVKLP